MKGNILLTLIILLASISILVLMTAKNSLLAHRSSGVQVASFQLRLMADEALAKVGVVMRGLPVNVEAVDWRACGVGVCVITPEPANFFLEQAADWWTGGAQAVILPVQLHDPRFQAYSVLEYLGCQAEPGEKDTHEPPSQFWRSTVFITTTQPPILSMRVQASWQRDELHRLVSQQSGEVLTTITNNQSPMVLQRLSWRQAAG